MALATGTESHHRPVKHQQNITIANSNNALRKNKPTDDPRQNKKARESVTSRQTLMTTHLIFQFIFFSLSQARLICRHHFVKDLFGALRGWTLRAR
jgi:hypothetical protein